MVIKRTGKIWIGVGAAASLTAGGPPAEARDAMARSGVRVAQAQTDAKQAPGHTEHGAPPAAQGGEGGEGAADGLDPRVRLFRDFALIRGHLLVGDELVKAGLWNEALPHFHHPVEELYAWMSPRLKGQGVRQFDGQLKALSQTVQAKNAAAYANALKVARQRMDDAEAGMRKFATPYLTMRVNAATAALLAAANEYKEAVEDGKIAKPVEYQDSRGFVLEAERMLESVAAELGKKNKAALDATRAALGELKKAWPTATAPEAAVKSHAEVQADVSKVELAASPLLRD